MLTIYLIILILVWTINPFIKKIASEKIGIDEFLIVSAFVFGISIFLYYFYSCHFMNKKLHFNKLYELEFKDIFLIIGVNLSWVLGVIVFIKLINMTEISYLIPQVQCIIIALTFIIGYLIFNESFSIKKGLGLFFIILGILFINMKSEKK